MLKAEPSAGRRSETAGPCVVRRKSGQQHPPRHRKKEKDPDAESMEFPFDVDLLFGERITTVDQHLQPSGRKGAGLGAAHR